MKNKLFALLIASTLLVSCGPTTNDAVKFNDKVVEAQKGCIAGEKSFFKACDGYKADEIKASYESFSKAVDSSVKILTEIKDVEEFASFKTNAANLVNAYKKLMPVEYNEYAKIYAMPNDLYTSKDSARCVEVAAKINATLNPLVQSFIAEQEQFAKKWKFMLTK